MSENPWLKWAAERKRREEAAVEKEAKRLLQGPANHRGTEIPNEKTRHIILNSAEIICIAAPPRTPHESLSLSLSSSLNIPQISMDDLINLEISQPSSPYIPALQTKFHNKVVPDRMYIDLLGRFLEKRILQGQNRFLVDGFPRNENQAAILEEAVPFPLPPGPNFQNSVNHSRQTDLFPPLSPQICQIHAFISISGPKPSLIDATTWTRHISSIQRVYDKLAPQGRCFKVNIQEDPYAIEGFVANVVATIRSARYEARLMVAEDVFRPDAPTRM
ncbi:MAG: hypothetical protein L6R40_002394 [Gallowayella cf. fulva]|nr:MAG: hypothetical protein L6R40_002394 [Xanthomendoza cf. fulva]